MGAAHLIFQGKSLGEKVDPFKKFRNKKTRYQAEVEVRSLSLFPSQQPASQ